MATEQKVSRLRRRHRRVRKKVTGTPSRPRLAVYRSNRHLYAQVIDDVTGHTLVHASTLAHGDDSTGGRMGKAKGVGRAVAGKAMEAGITKVTFDRGGFKYHGLVRAVADGAREGGLEL